MNRDDELAWNAFEPRGRNRVQRLLFPQSAFVAFPDEGKAGELGVALPTELEGAEGGVKVRASPRWRFHSVLDAKGCQCRELGPAIRLLHLHRDVADKARGIDLRRRTAVQLFVDLRTERVLVEEHRLRRGTPSARGSPLRRRW